MEEQVQMNEKLRALLEKAKREKKIASKDLHRYARGDQCG